MKKVKSDNLDLPTLPTLPYLLTSYRPPSNPRTLEPSEFLFLFFSGFWELLGEGELELELSRFGRGTSKSSALITFYLLASWEHKSGDDEKSGSEGRCSL